MKNQYKKADKCVTGKSDELNILLIFKAVGDNSQLQDEARKKVKIR